MENKQLIDKLENEHNLSRGEWLQLVSSFDDSDREYARALAQKISIEKFGKTIYFRGIVEFTNICRCDCYYCGIRRSNCNVQRYRLSDDDILECCHEGYEFGYRTFVLQGGEDGWWDDDKLCRLVERIRREYPDCAITLSVGERSRESYAKLKNAGADRYLLRHETATREHYEMLHPASQTLENRLRCLNDLRELGYQTGCGIMVGTPGQTDEFIANDMLFMCDFKPQMVGIGPFIPHKDTPFRDKQAGSTEKTLFLLSLIRIAMPGVLLPSTTALGTVEGNGRQLGVLAGCNVVMPNLSPLSVRKKYMLYDNKVGTEVDAAAGLESLRRQMEEIGYEVVTGRGDYKEDKND